MRKLHFFVFEDIIVFYIFCIYFFTIQKVLSFHMNILSLSQAAGRKDVLLLTLQASSW